MKVLLFVSILQLLGSCSISLESIYYTRAQEAARARDYKKALENFERVVRGHPESEKAIPSALEAASISSKTKDFTKTVEFLRFVVQKTRDEKEMLSAQTQLAEVLFEKIADYPAAIIEFNRLLQFSPSKEEQIRFKTNIAKAHFYVNAFDQAITEVNSLLKDSLTPKQEFETLTLKGNILLAQKSVDSAIEVFVNLTNRFPAEAAAEKIGMSLAVGYEEKGEFVKAISVLEGLAQNLKGRPHDHDFVTIKLDRLRQRKAQQPGAKGLKK